MGFYVLYHKMFGVVKVVSRFSFFSSLMYSCDDDYVKWFQPIIFIYTSFVGAVEILFLDVLY